MHVINLHLLFIDFKKAFDTINEKKFLESLLRFGIPKKIKRLVKMTLIGAQAKVIVDGKISNPFPIGKGGLGREMACQQHYSTLLSTKHCKTLNKVTRF